MPPSTLDEKKDSPSPPVPSISPPSYTPSPIPNPTSSPTIALPCTLMEVTPSGINRRNRVIMSPSTPLETLRDALLLPLTASYPDLSLAARNLLQTRFETEHDIDSYSKPGYWFAWNCNLLWVDGAKRERSVWVYEDNWEACKRILGERGQGDARLAVCWCWIEDGFVERCVKERERKERKGRCVMM